MKINFWNFTWFSIYVFCFQVSCMPSMSCKIFVKFCKMLTFMIPRVRVLLEGWYARLTSNSPNFSFTGGCRHLQICGLEVISTWQNGNKVSNDSEKGESKENTSFHMLWIYLFPSRVGSLLNETKHHLVSFSLLLNETKWHLVSSSPN